MGDATHNGIVAFVGSNPNTYRGGTTVTNGILRIDAGGSGTGSGVVTINNLGRLAGVGPASGNVVVNSGGATFPGGTNGNTSYVNMNISGNLTFGFRRRGELQLGIECRQWRHDYRDFLKLLTEPMRC